MKKFVFSFAFVFLLCIAASAQKEWAGTYTFDEDGGKNAGGTVIYIVHELVVLETDDGLRATLKSNGYQTSKDLNCSAKVVGNKLQIVFESYGEDNVFETYEKGDLLLTLEKKAVKGKPQIVTFWGKFTPIIPEKPKTGLVFFVKSSATEIR